MINHSNKKLITIFIKISNKNALVEINNITITDKIQIIINYIQNNLHILNLQLRQKKPHRPLKTLKNNFTITDYNIQNYEILHLL